MTLSRRAHRARRPSLMSSPGSHHASSMATPRRPMDYGAILARSVVRSLADRSSRDACLDASARFQPRSRSIRSTGKRGSGSCHFACPACGFEQRRALPWLSAFPELNVRTYVVADRKPGVWFFSLDARNAAVAIARAWFHLPYFRARMNCEDRSGWIQYCSERTHHVARPGALQVSYRPVAEVFEAKPGTLEHFLTERYCLYSADPRGRLYRGEIHHQPWPLQIAEADFRHNTMTEAAALGPSIANPLLHFSRRQDVVVWHPHRIS